MVFTHNHFKCGRLPALVAIAAAISIASPVQGRVFLRWGRGGEALKPELLGGREAFRGELEIDGVRTDTQVLSTRYSCQMTLNRLGSSFENDGAEFRSFTDAEMGWGLAIWPDRKATVFVLAPRVIKSTLVFVFHSPLERGQPGRRDLLPGIATYPGARIRRTAARKKTGLKIVFLDTNASAGEVLGFYESNLFRAGWRPLIADRLGRGAPESMLLYTKDGSICTVSVKSSGVDQGNVIAVLVKES